MTGLFKAIKQPDKLETTLLIEETNSYEDRLPLKNLVFLERLNENKCVINSPQFNIRLTNFLPMFVMLLAITIYTLISFVNTHAARKNDFDGMIKYMEQQYGQTYQTDERSHRFAKNYIPYFGKEKASTWEYLKAYYSGKYYSGGDTAIFGIILWLIFFPGALFVSGYLTFFLPPSYLIADRKRNILYTFNKNDVFLTRYDEAQFGYAGKMLAIKLHCIDPETDELATQIFRPNISHYSSYLTSSDSENQRFITFVNAFMQQGRDAVATENFKRRKPFLFFGKTPLPADFEQQVTSILARIDKEKTQNAQ